MINSSDPNHLRNLTAQLERSIARNELAAFRLHTHIDSERQLLADVQQRLRQMLSPQVPPALQRIVDAEPGPARIVDRYYKVQAVNHLDRALEGQDITGQCAAVRVLSAEARMGYVPEIDFMADLIAGHLYHVRDQHPDDEGLKALIRHLVRFPHFDVVWPTTRRGVSITDYALTRPNVDGIGELRIEYASLSIPGWPGSRLLTGRARDRVTRARFDRLGDRLTDASLGPAPVPRRVRPAATA